jgi:hypothetical protein
MDEKTCTLCGVEKPLAEFYRNIRGAGGVGSRCKACARAEVNSRYVPRVRAPVTAACPQCGEKFTHQPTMGTKRTYCSRKCTAAHGEELKRQRNADLEPRRCACGSTDVAGVGTPACPDCKKDRRSPAAEQRRKDRERRRTLARYGLSPADYDGFVRRQRNRCAVCRTTKVGGPPTRSGYWHVDHDHVTGQIRGLLCSKCNTAIGLLQDDPGILAAATSYVAKHRQMELFQRKAG